MRLHRYIAYLVLVVIPLTVGGCWRSETYKGISLSDPRLAEFSDLLQVDRSKLGIPTLPSFADVSVERSNGSSYDVMLHVYSKYQQRTIAFRRVGGALKWIHEQVIIEGPRTHTTVDGTFQEELCFTYETSRVADYRLNRLNISYSGPEKTLDMRSDLTLEEVEPLLTAWLARP